MPPESVLFESRTLRASVIGRTGVLDKVKALTLLPDGVHVTTQGVADYYEVGERVVNKILQRHREELESNGFRVLRGADLREFIRDIKSLCPSSYPQARSNLGIFTRRAVLNVGMLLRDSEIAHRVRAYLLDAEGDGNGGEVRSGEWDQPGRAYASFESLVTNAAAKAAAMVLDGPIGARLDAVDRRLDAHGRVICAMSDRLCRLGDEVTGMRQDIARIDDRLDGFAEVLRTRLPKPPRRRR
jgi:hypothetical protein